MKMSCHGSPFNGDPGKTREQMPAGFGGAVFSENHAPVLFPSLSRKRQTRIGELSLLKAGET